MAKNFVAYQLLIKDIAWLLIDVIDMFDYWLII